MSHWIVIDTDDEKRKKASQIKIQTLGTMNQKSHSQKAKHAKWRDSLIPRLREFIAKIRE